MACSPDHPVVSLARRYLVTFYALADKKDAALMDSLVLTRAALLAAIECPREGLPVQIRDKFERTSDSPSPRTIAATATTPAQAA